MPEVSDGDDDTPRGNDPIKQTTKRRVVNLSLAELDYWPTEVCSPRETKDMGGGQN